MPRLPIRRRTARQVSWPLRGPTSVFVKGLRDSRRAVLLAGVGLGALVLFAGAATAQAFPTAESRVRIVTEMQQLPPVITGLLGHPINIDRLGGLISWRYGNLMPIFLGLWSVIALSGTLAGEIGAGSFEVLASVPLSRRRIALEKVAVHVAGQALAAILIAAFAWLTGILFAILPTDPIAFPDALVHFEGTALLALVGGAVAFAVGPLVGRVAAAGIGAAAMFAAYFVNAYAGVVSAFDTMKNLSWFTWTASERPLAGSWDVRSLIPVVVLVVILFAAGVLIFERRDVGATIAIRGPSLPGRRLLLRGPGGLAFLSFRGSALAWGIAIGAYAWLIALSTPGLLQLTSDPGVARLMDLMFAGLDWRTAGGFLQVVFFSFGTLLVGLAGAVMVNGVVADERERRLDLVLATPVSRARWLVANAVGLYVALGLLILVMDALLALGAVQAGQDALRPFLGVWVVGLYAAALAGVGLAVYGLGLEGLAAPVTALLAGGFLTWDLVAGAVRLSPELLNLSLIRHLGEPMVGTYDWPGLAILVALAVGGVALGAWGLGRRDLST